MRMASMAMWSGRDCPRCLSTQTFIEPSLASDQYKATTIETVYISGRPVNDFVEA